jgi:hypothetical protein
MLLLLLSLVLVMIQRSHLEELLQAVDLPHALAGGPEQ